jgi:hypothetical protein
MAFLSVCLVVSKKATIFAPEPWSLVAAIRNLLLANFAAPAAHERVVSLAGSHALDAVYFANPKIGDARHEH